ncbi:hypothetical protein SY94_4350 [Agrobacterium tumefaciens]|nr:hypothetical protein SY94_4350 [Agrobacterium tumefaciens]
MIGRRLGSRHGQPGVGLFCILTIQHYHWLKKNK